MDFDLTEEQSALSDMLDGFLERKHGFQDYLRSVKGGSVPLWSEFAELGLLAAGISDEEGETMGGPVETAIIAEQLGRRLVAAPFLVTAVFALQTLEALGSSDACIRLKRGIVSGEKKVVLAHLEPDGFWGPAETQARAVATPGGGFRLTGAKTGILYGPNADLLLVSAIVEGGASSGGVTLFAVEPRAAGLRHTRYRLLDGRVASDIVLDGVEVTANAVVGDERKALPAIQTGFDHVCVQLCADSVGAMDAALRMTCDYLRVREQFGRPLSEFQALQHAAADMHVEVELARSMLYQGLAALERAPSERSRMVSAAKASVAKSGLFVGQKAIQLHGGIGMTDEYAVGHFYKRLVVNASLFGGVDFHMSRYGADARQ